MFILRGILILLLISGVPPSAFAARHVITCSQAYLTLERVRHDSAVELEMTLSDQVMRLLTSQNDFVSGVISGEKIPAHVRERIEKSYGAKAEEIPWEKLQFEDRRQLLRLEAKQRGASFFDDRKMHGMKVKEKIELYFDRPTEFLGQEFPRGRHEIDVSSVLGRSPVEYASPKDLEQANFVELHFRGPYPAGKLSQYARVLQDALYSEQKHQHVHIVAPLPVEKLKADPKLESAKMADYFRRANLFSEITYIFDTGRIATSKDEIATYFDSLTRENLREVTTRFYRAGLGKPLVMGDEFKMGWVGIRGSDKYDQPNLWGLEYRNVYPSAHMPFIEQSLDTLQWGMEHAEYGVPDDRMQRWLEKFAHNGSNPAHAVESAWYRGYPTASEFLHAIPPSIRAKLDLAKLRPHLEELLPNHTELQMLAHDWSKDPLFFDDPVALKSIRGAQYRALKGLNELWDPTYVMQDFLWDSGIAKTVGKSMRTEMHMVRPEYGYLEAVDRTKGLPKEKAKPVEKFWEWLHDQQEW